ncbi:MAG TPA: GPW/gp25 family protein [Actinomycetota bacterium]|nr:GPW/gp25 family protein [Actinomycetota bacterium]
MTEDFVGKGWAFPVRTSASGGIALVGREQEVEEAIRLIIGTAYGERPMRPEFGCAIHDFVFAAVTGSTAGRIAYEVRRSIERWEPRVDVEGIAVTTDPADASTVYIDVQYSIRGTNDPRNLVFPFYVIPSETLPEAGVGE